MRMNVPSMHRWIRRAEFHEAQTSTVWDSRSSSLRGSWPKCAILEWRWLSPIAFALALAFTAWGAEPATGNPSADPARPLREYRDFALGHDGNVARGRELFNDEQRAACVKCHSVDGSSGKAGPDLWSIGDRFPRQALIRAVLEPSAEIAIGYGTTIVETKSGEEFLGIVKEIGRAHV